MELWTIWINAIQGILDFLSSQVGLSAGCSIVVMTLLLRAAVLPLTWSSAYRGIHSRQETTRAATGT
jgi:membrane protein insertase Oxa1/YidC/SpoIIIJ